METDDTRQIETAAADHPDSPPQGYSMGAGAPQPPPTREELERLLMWIPIDEALTIKDRWGIDEHRGGDESQPFNGYPPAMIHGEGLDLVNYAQYEMARCDHGTQEHEILEEIREAGMKAIRGARLLAQNGG